MPREYASRRGWEIAQAGLSAVALRYAFGLPMSFRGVGQAFVDCHLLCFLGGGCTDSFSAVFPTASVACG